MTELTMCECGHAAIHHYAHGRCGVENEMCSCLNLVTTMKGPMTIDQARLLGIVT